MTAPTAAHRALVSALPQFLRAWSRGWVGIRPLLVEAGLEPPQFFLLRALIQESDPGAGMTEAAMIAHLGNPYTILRPELAALPALLGKSGKRGMGFVARSGDGHYWVTSRGRTAFLRVETAKNAYLASVRPASVPAADVAWLADALHDLGERLWHAPEPAVKAHAARSRRVAVATDAAPMTRLLDAVYALWYARDDAHIAAWRAAVFAGPTFDLLSRVWASEANNVPALVAAVAPGQRPEDVTAGLASLVAADYMERDGDALRLTPHGQTVRDAIEAETDRTYFAPWPPDADIIWLRDTLTAVIAGLP